MMWLGFEPLYLGVVARIANHYDNRLMSALENVKYIYYFTDELFDKRLVFWFIEGTDNRWPALQLAVKNFYFSLSSASCPETGFIRDSRFQQKFPHHTNTPCSVYTYRRPWRDMMSKIQKSPWIQPGKKKYFIPRIILNAVRIGWEYSSIVQMIQWIQNVFRIVNSRYLNDYYGSYFRISSHSIATFLIPHFFNMTITWLRYATCAAILVAFLKNMKRTRWLGKASLSVVYLFSCFVVKIEFWKYRFAESQV